MLKNKKKLKFKNKKRKLVYKNGIIRLLKKDSLIRQYPIRGNNKNKFIYKMKSEIFYFYF